MTTKTQPSAEAEIPNNTSTIAETKEVLSDIYKNATMAQNAIKVLLPYVEEPALTHNLHKQVEEYDKYIEKCGTLASELSFEPTPAPKIAVAMASFELRMKMMTNKRTTHVAKIMLQGTLNGIIDLYRLKKQSDKTTPETSKLLTNLLDYEEEVFESLKVML